MTWGERFYRALLRCYPAEFRYEYAAEMTQVFRDRQNETSAWLLWFDLIADTFLTAAKEHRQMLWNDLRYTARTLRKSPVFTGAAILTLALGIGATTAIFSVVYAVMLRPLPFADPGRLMQIAERNDKLGLAQFASSIPNFVSWKERSHSFEQMGAVGGGSFNLTGRGDPQPLTGATMTANVLPMLGLHPLIGRTFSPDEEKPGAPKVVMVDEHLWRSQFNADPNLVGQSLTLNGTSYAVVGIAPQALQALTGAALAMPLTIDVPHDARLQHMYTTIGRLRPGVTVKQAQAEMDAVSRKMGQQYPEVKGWGIRLITFYKTFVSDQLQTALVVLLAAVGAVLLIACANVANLMLSRAAGRQREIAVRVAMGASAGRLIRQLLTESVALAVVGGGIGIGAAIWVVKLANGPALQGVLPVPNIAVDATVMWFALGITLMTGLLFGTAPAWHAAKTDLNTILKQGGRLSTGGVRPILRNGLVAAELALATVLLIGAGLLLQSLLRMHGVRPGFRADHLMTFQLALPPSRYPNTAATYAFDRLLFERLNRLPGIKASAVSSGIPFGAGIYNTTPMQPVQPAQLPAGTSVPVDWRTVTPDYFRTMEIPLLRGRFFTEADGPDAPARMVVSQETAHRFWGDEDPVGKSIMVVGNRKVYTVVGVVGNVHNIALNTNPNPAIYMSSAAAQYRQLDVVVRTATKPESVMPAVRRVVHELDAELPVANVRTMEDWISNSTAQPRLNGILVGVFAGIALIIAAIGIYGVLSYSVNQRTREIGLRMALGAQSMGVVRLVVKEGMLVAMAGIAVGVGAALGLSRLWSSLLFEVRGQDPLTFAGVAAFSSIIALAACYLPARRASRVDPIVALREE